MQTVVKNNPNARVISKPDTYSQKKNNKIISKPDTYNEQNSDLDCGFYQDHKGGV
jgi:hypothetical protein